MKRAKGLSELTSYYRGNENAAADFSQSVNAPHINDFRSTTATLFSVEVVPERSRLICESLHTKSEPLKKSLFPKIIQLTGWDASADNKMLDSSKVKLYWLPFGFLLANGTSRISRELTDKLRSYFLYQDYRPV